MFSAILRLGVLVNEEVAAIVRLGVLVDEELNSEIIASPAISPEPLALFVGAVVANNIGGVSVEDKDAC